MAGKEENKPVEEEMKIPVFTVLKGGYILKNIILRNPASVPESDLLQESGIHSEKCGQEGEKLLVGRHPDCDIILDHPSVSRFHLRIWLQPLLQKISVIDLSSVHGTWVLEQRIEPQVPVELNEGDTLRIGASTRIYRLQWVSFSDAFETENPINSSAPIPEENEEAYQDENLVPSERKQDDLWAMQIPSVPPMPDWVSSDSPQVLYFCDNLSVKKENPILEEASSFFPNNHLEKENHSPPNINLEEKGVAPDASQAEESVSSPMPLGVLLASDAQLEAENCSPEARFATEVLSERESRSPVKRSSQQYNSSLRLRNGEAMSYLDVYRRREGCSGAGIEAGNQKENMHVEEDKRDQENQKDVSGFFASPHTAGSMSSSIPLRVLSASDAQVEIEQCSPEEHFTTEVKFEGQNPSPPIRSGQRDMLNLWSRRGKSSSLIRLHTGRKQSSDIGTKSGNRKEIMYVDQIKKEEETLCKALFSADDEEDESIPSDKENMTPQGLPRMKSQKAKPIQQTNLLKTSFEVIGANSDAEEGLFSADKESRTPKSSYEMKSKKQTSANQRRIKPEMIIQQPYMLKTSLDVIVADSDAEEELFSSDRENRTPISYEMQSKKQTSANQRRIKPEMNVKRRAERVPFQPLLPNSSNSKSVSVPNATTSKNSNSVNYRHMRNEIDSSPNHSVDQAALKAGESKRKWYMVVDTSCLLHEESRRSLKLLEALKGTQLLIPRMVIRELDCLKRRGSWFKKENEASSVLQWIEECMTKMRWWIHVQSSTEGMPIAPTPPASPRFHFSEGSNEFGSINSMPFSTCGSLMEIVSPTAEDHILECALFFKRIKNDGQLVLLTNDTALKIKAMAEGLICENAKEFHKSLVNPYSERFMWVESTPIGPTRSCVEGTGVKENNHYCAPIRKTIKAADGAKGLKLILLHNSHYGQIDPVK